MPDDPNPRYLVSPAQVRRAYLLGGIGAVALIVGLFLLAGARPQGTFAPLDDAQHQQRLMAAEDALSGFELVGEGARIDIGHAMQLVVERGVGLPIHAGGAAPVAAVADVLAQEVDGAALYAQHCGACHQASGAGIPGAFPPVADHIGALVAADRAYPAKLVLFGLMGAIEVKGTPYAGAMPGLGAMLSDAEVAGLLEYTLTAWDDVEALGDAYEPYTAEEIAEWRALALTMADVHQIRLELELP